MPIQHASDAMLKAMNRGATVKNTRALIRKLRDRVPDLTLRSSVIAGFPGEREEHVRELLDFVEEIRFKPAGRLPLLPRGRHPGRAARGRRA